MVGLIHTFDFNVISLSPAADAAYDLRFAFLHRLFIADSVSLVFLIRLSRTVNAVFGILADGSQKICLLVKNASYNLSRRS